MTKGAAESGEGEVATKRTVADIHPYCMGEMFISLDPDGQLWKRTNGCEADEQTKKSMALALARGVQEHSTFKGSARKISGTVHYGSDTAGR